MRSIYEFLKVGVILVSLAIFGGCGGGGGSSYPLPSTIISGTAAKGVIYPGTISVYAVDAAGVKADTPLATVATDQNGHYTAMLGSYTGMVIVEAYGTYTDDATGTTVTIPAGAPLHAMVPAVDPILNNFQSIAVTPLTELAFRMAGATMTPLAAAAANSRVAELFKVPDIIATQPVKFDAAHMSASGVTLAQQAYTLALATFSQMAKDSGGGAAAAISQISALLDSFKTDLASAPTAGLGTANLNAFTSALSTINGKPGMSGFGDAIAILGNAGVPVVKLTLAVANVPTGVHLGSFKATIHLPAGASVRADSSGETVSGVIMPAGVAATGTASVLGNYQAGAGTLTVSLISTAGFTSGDCATITIDLAQGTSVSAADFSLTINEAKDAGPTFGPVAGVSATLR